MVGQIIMLSSSHLIKTSCRHLNIYLKLADVMMAGWIIMPPSSHLLKMSCPHLNIYSKQVDMMMAGQIIMPPSSHLLKMSYRHLHIYSKRVDVIMVGQIFFAWTFSDSWNRKNQWWERIINWQEHVTNWWERILQSEKWTSNENSGVQKVRNWNNCGILRNSKQISQASLGVSWKRFTYSWVSLWVIQQTNNPLFLCL